MHKGRILVVEDEFDIANMLKIYFKSQGYEVDIAGRGTEALEMTRKRLPNLILLDIMMPDMDGYEVCKRLRTTNRTKHIPIIFLTQKDDRSDKIAGLELGADDFVTKPFDIEELKLRVNNTIRLSQENNQRDPRSGLPAGKMIEEQLRALMRRDGWAYIDLKIDNFDPFKEKYGYIAANELMRSMRMLLAEVLESAGTDDDFVGHPGGENFIVITTMGAAPKIESLLRKRFLADSAKHYSFEDKDAGGIVLDKKLVPFMRLSIGTVTPEPGMWISDIREITELGAERRRADR